MANPLIQQIAEGLGLTTPVNGSWIQAIADFYGITSPVNGSWEQAIAIELGATGPVNGTWIQAIADAVGLTQTENGTWLFAIEQNGLGPSFPVPTSLTNTAQGYTTLDYTWTAGGTETSWEVEYGLAGVGGTFATAVTESYQMTSLDPATLYELRVRAIISAGTFSNYTAPVVAETNTIGVPANLAASGETSSSFVAYWDAVADADSYEVEVTGEGTFTSSTTSVTISGLSAETSYDFRARAIIEGFEGAWTAFASATTLSAATFSMTGGTVTTDGIYTYRTFTTTDSLIVDGEVEIDYLIVAGGAGGGGSRYEPTAWYGSGGGGAGGYLAFSAQTINSGTFPIVIGAGGNGGAGGVSPTWAQYGANGNNSSFSGITSTGGGGGAGRTSSAAKIGNAGGSGGGSIGNGGTTAVGGAASPAGQGNPGGDSLGGGRRGSSAGGGAGAKGGDGGFDFSGDGGAGLAWLNGTYYAGGGGGGEAEFDISAPTDGGIGGGGAGGNNSVGSPGTANTGGGGGGGGSNSGVAAYAGGNGGSGIVIIRYVTP